MKLFNFSVIEGRLRNDPIMHDDKCIMYIKNDEIVFRIQTSGTIADVCMKHLKNNSRVLCSGKMDGGDTMIAKEINFLQDKE